MDYRELSIETEYNAGITRRESIVFKKANHHSLSWLPYRIVRIARITLKVRICLAIQLEIPSV